MPRFRFEYKYIFTAKPQVLLRDILPSELMHYPISSIHAGEHYIYATGDVPILLVAHVDTVWKNAPDICFDPERQILWSIHDGLGADDRAGVAAILEILKRGYLPSVLFVDGEETDKRGVIEALKEFTRPSRFLYVVELDRHGSRDSVFYSLDCPEFEEYVNSFGFKTAEGTNSDITVLCPCIGIAGVNLSTGYHCEHTKGEYLSLPQWNTTVETVCRMLDNPPSYCFVWNSKKQDYFKDIGYKARRLLKKALRAAAARL